jgi:hypothetical protein
MGQFFGLCFREFKKKQKQDQKQLGIRFAHKLFFSLRSIYESNLESSHPFGMLCKAGD